MCSSMDGIPQDTALSALMAVSVMEELNTPMVARTFGLCPTVLSYLSSRLLVIVPHLHDREVTSSPRRGGPPTDRSRVQLPVVDKSKRHLVSTYYRLGWETYRNCFTQR